MLTCASLGGRAYLKKLGHEGWSSESILSMAISCLAFYFLFSHELNSFSLPHASVPNDTSQAHGPK